MAIDTTGQSQNRLPRKPQLERIVPISSTEMTDIKTQSEYVVTMEHIIKRYIDDMMHLRNSEFTFAETSVGKHLDYVMSFVRMHARMRLACDYMNYSKAKALWARLRDDNDEFAPFILAVTAEFRLIYPGEKFDNICNEVADSFTLNEGDSSIIRNEDTICDKMLDSKTNRYRVLRANPWVLTIILISMMRPL